MATNTNIQIVRGNLMLGGDITTDEVTPTFSVDRQNARVAIGTDASSVPDPYTMYVSGEMYATRLHGDGSQLTGLTDSAWGPAGDDISYVDGDVSIGITESNGKRLRVHESGNDVLVVDGANLRVGVATGSPNANLHVEGNVYVSSNLEVSNINFTGSFNQNGTPFESSPWTTTGDDLSYTTGNVGIGTPSPDANLHVEGNIYVSSNLEVDGATISTITEPPTPAWATSIGGTSSDYGYGIATDGAGNVYVTGNYQGTATFAPGTTLTSAGSSDAFVAKYNTSGTAQWATSIGGTSSDYGYGIATDSAGNVYVTGRYVLTADFGSGVSITSAGSYDAFFAKYNTSGIVQWATSIGGTFSIDAGYGIATDSAGNVYVTGYHDGTVTIGSTTLTSAGNYDAFVAKYSSLKNLRIYTGLEVGTANLFVDTVNSRVGIGTTTPGYTLDVQGDLNVSGTTTNVSDKRLKSNVHVIENALEKVGKLSGYTFTMNNKQNAGVIAQEVLEVLPEVVGGSEETTYSVAYGNMASLFIEAIKELKHKVETLENRI